MGSVPALKPREVIALLEAHGFRSLGISDRASGDIGCGRIATDRGTYEKEWRDTGFFASYRWVWVHEFSCDGKWQVVIVSSTNAERQAAQLRDALSEEFAQEVASGVLAVKTRYRIPLE